ncbi:MAG: aminoacyl-tRNA hydrolase, partial [Gaiellaceae bacterium]
PGERNARTRHNVGWRVLAALEQRWRCESAERTELYTTRRAEVADRNVVLMWPLTYMNESGQALVTWLEHNPTEESEVLVVSDDVYLPTGTIRFRPQGSSGGHRGLESIEASLATRGFARLRIGVGETQGAELREHVLEGFEPDEEAVMEEVIPRAAEAVECWVIDGIGAAMNRFNRRANKEAEAP